MTIGLGALIASAPPAAASNCSFSSSTLSITLTGGHGVTIGRTAGGTIVLTGSGWTPGACGSPQVTTVNTVVVTVSGGADNAVTIDLTNGPMGPGVTNEGAPPAISEIEFNIDLGDGDDSFTIIGSSGADTITLGQASASSDPVAAFNSDTDADVTPIANVEDFTVNARGGDDTVSAAGGSAIGGVGAMRDDVTLNGEAGNDTLTGGNDGDTLAPGPGTDSVTGGLGTDDVSYSTSTVAVNVDLTVTTGWGGDAAGDTNAADDIEDATGGSGNDTLTGDAAPNTLTGGPGADILSGAGGDDVLTGGSGGDTLTGGETGETGGDWINYSGSLFGVSIDLGAGTASGSFSEAAGDVLTPNDIENIFGTFTGDTLTGSGDDNTFLPLSGADALSAGAGVDTVDYSFSGLGVAVDLRVTTGWTGGDAAGDTNSTDDIENVNGSFTDDALTGDAGPNKLVANWGNDFLTGLEGDDVLKGGSGADTITGGEIGETQGDTLDYSPSIFSFAFGGVTVNLGTGTASGFFSDASGDVLTANDMENVIGSTFSDSLTGSAEANTIRGGRGNDTENGGDGDDTFDQENSANGADVMDGGNGNDLVNYSLRINTISVTFDNVANDGEVGENDNVRSNIESASTPGTPPAPTLTPVTPDPGNDITPTWSFTGQGGATFECELTRGATVISTFSSCSSPKTFDLSAQPDGAYTFKVRQTVSGNTGPSASDDYTLDTAVSAPSLTPVVPDPGNDETPTWSFTGEAAANFECELTLGATVISALSGCSSPKTYDLSSQPDGVYSFKVRQTDTAGNVSAFASDDYTLDTTAAAPSLTAVSPDPGNDTTPSWIFAGEPGGTFECELSQGATVISPFGACSSPKTHDLALEPDATYTFKVRQTDLAGNTSAVASDDYTLDTTPPDAPTITGVPVDPGNDLTPTWTFTGDGTSTFSCELTRGATVISAFALCSNPKTYDLSAQPDGIYTFKVRQADAAGNTGPNVGDDYTLDTAAPPPPTLTVQPGDPSNDATPTWSFTGEVGASFECSLRRGVTVVYALAACTSPKTYDLTAEPDATYVFNVRQTDLAGNTGAVASDDYTLDRSVPAPPTITASPPNPGNDVTPTWSFTGEAGVTFECRLMQGATVIFGFAPCTSSHSYNLSASPDAIYTFGVRAIDGVGNPSGVTSGDYTLDTTKPAAPTITATPTDPSNDTTPTWSFTGDESSAIECELTRGATVIFPFGVCISPKTFNLALETDGTYTFAVRQTDLAGNISDVATDDYTLDTAAPAIPVITSVPVDPGNDPTPTWTFTGDGTSALQCELIRGATVISAFSACPSPRTYDLSAQPDGIYTFRVRQTDAAGNSSLIASDDYRLDTTAAAPSLTPVVPDPSNDETPTWSFTGEAGATFQCELTRGVTVISALSVCTSPQMHDLSAQPDGIYTFKVRQTDAASNTSADSADDYTLDTADPGAPTITAMPTDPGNDTTPTWSFTGEPSGTFQCELRRGAIVISPFGPCNSPMTYDLALESDGTYTFNVRQTDAAGNTGPSASDDYTMDTTVPLAPTITSAPGDPGSDNTPNWSFTGEPGVSFECQLSQGATVISAYEACSSSHSYDLTSAPDATYTFAVRAVKLGVPGPEAIDDYTLDTIAPAVPTLSPADPDPSNDVTPTWSFSGEPSATFECELTRGATVISPLSACPSPKTYDLSSEPDGVYSFTVRQIDAAGNPGVSTSDDYTLDTLVPPAPSLSPATPDPSNDTSPTWSFTGEVGGSFECELRRGATVVSAFSICPSPKTYDLSTEPDGVYSFTVRQVDPAGNTGATSSDDYTLDVSGPSVSFTVLPPDPGNDSTPTWGFTGEAGATFTCELTRGATVVSASSACTSPRTYDLTSQPDGTYIVRVVATDTIGNVGPPLTNDYTFDTTAPATSTIDSGPGAIGNDPTPSWSFSNEPGASFECQLSVGATVISGFGPCSSPKTYDLSSQPDGTYSFSVRATDLAGNQGPTTSSDYTLDTVLPLAPVLISSPPSPSIDPTPTWLFVGEPGASFECQLSQGASVIFGFAPCSSPQTYDLSSLPDGIYSIAIRQKDPAGNIGPVTMDTYSYDASPTQPVFTAVPRAVDDDETPIWGFVGEPGVTFECQVSRGAAVISGLAPCSTPFTLNLDSSPDGTYTFAVRAIDAHGRISPTATVNYILKRSGLASANGIGGSEAAALPTLPLPDRGDDSAERPGSRRAHGGSSGSEGDEPKTYAARLLTTASKAIRFPLLLVLVVFLFIAIQHWIDRRDPKLALAPLNEKGGLEFSPPLKQP